VTFLLLEFVPASCVIVDVAIDFVVVVVIASLAPFSVAVIVAIASSFVADT